MRYRRPFEFAHMKIDTVFFCSLGDAANLFAVFNSFWSLFTLQFMPFETKSHLLHDHFVYLNFTIEMTTSMK